MIGNEDREYWSSIVGSGWKNIVLETFDRFNELAEKYQTEIYVQDVKEKYGVLRIYYCGPEGEDVWEEFSKVVKEAEHKSENTCQRCGKKGKLRTHRRWFITLCDECNYKEDERRKK